MIGTCLHLFSFTRHHPCPGGFCLHSVAKFSRANRRLSGTQPLLGRQQGALGLHLQVDQWLLNGADGCRNLPQVRRAAILFPGVTVLPSLKRIPHWTRSIYFTATVSALLLPCQSRYGSTELWWDLAINLEGGQTAFLEVAQSAAVLRHWIHNLEKWSGLQWSDSDRDAWCNYEINRELMKMMTMSFFSSHGFIARVKKKTQQPRDWQVLVICRRVTRDQVKWELFPNKSLFTQSKLPK